MNKKVVFSIIIILLIIVAILVGNVVHNDYGANGNDYKESNELIKNEDLNENIAEDQEKIDDKDIEKETTSDGNKILIAYFSRADENYSVGTVSVGNTEIMAGFIKDYLGDNVDTFKIDPVNAYPTDYRECTEVATQEKNSNARPEFKNADVLDISKYDTIFIGYPIWWGDVPMIINTFLEKYDFSGKTIIPFNTHEGSGNSGTYTTIKNKMSTSEVNTNGLAIRGADARKESSRSTVENWLKGLGY